MASAPFDVGPVSGRVDRDGRLVAADPALLRLQEEAGSSLGAPLALPQIAAVARSAMKLGVPLSRSVIAASNDRDLDLWVRAEPDAEGVNLTIDGWKAKPPAPPRLTLVANDHNFVSDVGDEFVPGPGTRAGNPAFVNPSAVGGDFHLLRTSLAIDAGRDDALDPGFTTDLDGGPRRIGPIDMGALESPFAAPVSQIPASGPLALFLLCAAIGVLARGLLATKR